MPCLCAVPLDVYSGSANVDQVVVDGYDGVMANLGGITRIRLRIGAALIDSDVVGASVIWWTDQAVWLGEVVDVVSLRLGGEGLPVGLYEDVVMQLTDATAGVLRIESPISLRVHP